MWLGVDTLPLWEYHTRMETIIALQPGESIWVWCSIHEEWADGWTYVSETGDGRHYAKADGITYIVPTENIYELAGDF